MGRGRRLPPLGLTEESRETLRNWSRRRKTAQALALRSRIVLRAADGVTATGIAAEIRSACRRSASGGAGSSTPEWTGCLVS